MSQGKLPAFLYYMLKGYITQFEKQVPSAEATLDNEKRTFHDIHTFVSNYSGI
jgi:diacylglycerol kinase family enzyme